MLRHVGRDSRKPEPLRLAAGGNIELPTARGRDVKGHGGKCLWGLIAPDRPGQRMRPRRVAAETEGKFVAAWRKQQ